MSMTERLPFSSFMDCVEVSSRKIIERTLLRWCMQILVALALQVNNHRWDLFHELQHGRGEFLSGQGRRKGKLTWQRCLWSKGELQRGKRGLGCQYLFFREEILSLLVLTGGSQASVAHWYLYTFDPPFWQSSKANPGRVMTSMTKPLRQLQGSDVSSLAGNWLRLERAAIHY